MLKKPVLFEKAKYSQEVSGPCNNIQTWACGKNTYN